MASYQTNKIFASSVEEAENRVFVPGSDYVFYVKEGDKLVNVKINEYGQKSVVVYTASNIQKTPIELRIEELEKKVNELQSATKTNVSVATSSNNEQPATTDTANG